MRRAAELTPSSPKSPTLYIHQMKLRLSEQRLCLLVNLQLILYNASSCRSLSFSVLIINLQEDFDWLIKGSQLRKYYLLNTGYLMSDMYYSLLTIRLSGFLTSYSMCLFLARAVGVKSGTAVLTVHSLIRIYFWLPVKVAKLSHLFHNCYMFPDGWTYNIFSIWRQYERFYSKCWANYFVRPKGDNVCLKESLISCIFKWTQEEIINSTARRGL
jgi:hypothetical protein